MPFSKYHLVQAAVTASGFAVDEVVCGLAAGADIFGKKWAYSQTHKIPVKDFPADWDTHGLKAGPIRNGEMADYADALIVFIWDNSRGSANMLKQMQNRNKPCFVVYNGVI